MGEAMTGTPAAPEAREPDRKRKPEMLWCCDCWRWFSGIDAAARLKAHKAESGGKCR